MTPPSAGRGRCCQMRTGVLLLGFALGTVETSLWVFFYTCRSIIRDTLEYELEQEWDLAILTLIVALDLIVNVLLVCGANKDYSGRKKDLRRWGFMVPWILVYSVNLVLLLGSSIVLCYVMSGIWKLLGVALLFWTIFVLLGFIMVIFFVLEQRADLDIHMHQRRRSDLSPSTQTQSVS